MAWWEWLVTIVAVYFYLLIGCALGVYSWKIYLKGIDDGGFSRIPKLTRMFLWPFSHAVGVDATRVGGWISRIAGDREMYLILSSFFLLLRLLWNVTLIVLVVFFKIIIVKIAIVPFKWIAALIEHKTPQ